MVRDIYKVSQEFELAIQKLAAKEKTGRKKVVSALEKSKKNYGSLKSTLDSLEEQAEKINAQLEKTRESCATARKDMLKFHKAIQNMDLTNASDVVFYDSGDVGYVISGTEYHCDVNDAGDLVKKPMRQHRKDKKAEKDKNEAPYSQKDDDSDDDDGPLAPHNQDADDSMDADDMPSDSNEADGEAGDKELNDLMRGFLKGASMEDELVALGSELDNIYD